MKQKIVIEVDEVDKRLITEGLKITLWDKEWFFTIMKRGKHEDIEQEVDNCNRIRGFIEKFK